MGKIVNRKEVEELLGCRITNKQFKEALEYAQRKQEYICKREHRPVVLQHWYLVKLTGEYIRGLALSNFTMDLYATQYGKRALCKKQERPTDTHIVAVPAL